MMRRYKKSGVILACVLCVIGIIYYFNLHHYITLDAIKGQSESLRTRVAKSYHSSVLVYMLVVLISLVACIPSTIPLVLLGGYLFGTLFGALYATVAATVGAVISFLLFRYWIKEFLQERYKSTLIYFKEKVQVYGVGYFLALHYSSLIPFFIINMIAALTDISLGVFIFICIAGSFPVYLIFAFAGRQLSEIQSPKDVFSPSVILAIVLLISLVVVPMLVRKWRAGKKEV